MARAKPKTRRKAPPNKVVRSVVRSAGDFDALYRSYMDLQRQVEHLSSIREIGLAVNASIELSETLPVVANVVQGALDVERVTIFLLEDGGTLAKPVIAKYGRDLITQDRLEEDSANVQGTRIDDAIKRHHVVFANTQLHQSAYVPLIAKDTVLGVMRLDEKGDGSYFSQDDADLYRAVGSQIAVAINNAQLYAMAVQDGLTKLYVRRYFDLRMEEELDQAKRYGRVFSLMMFDIDHFKKFNDTHGHQTGDMVLQQFARILQEQTRKSDICCRYGGEEMAVILPETGIEDAANLARKLCEYIRNHTFRGEEEKELKVTSSIGAGEYSKSFETIAQMVKACDEALYRAKENGRDRFELATLGA